MSDLYDVVVAGAGIHGAGVAQAAAAAGYSVLVIEQTGIASGTSSRSSKLIHGGLRYLENFQLSLVRECIAERELLLKLAPDLVQLHPFHIPVYRQTTRRPWQLRAGLSLYAMLGGLKKHARFRVLAKNEWARLDGLTTRDLQQVFCYYDAQTDDAALTRAVMHSAQTLGAELLMPATLQKVTRHADGCRIDVESDGQLKQYHASVFVNAAGPWVNRVLENVTPPVTPLAVELVQGTHLVIDGRVQQGMYYLESPADRRAVFVMPWQDKMLIGTTETVYSGDPAQVKPLQREQDYLLSVLRHYFPAYRETDIVVQDAFAGLRVLPAMATSTGTAFGHPRDTVLWPDDKHRPTVLTVYGGKLTAYRATAERVMSCIRSQLPVRKAVADTRLLQLLLTD